MESIRVEKSCGDAEIRRELQQLIQGDQSVSASEPETETVRQPVVTVFRQISGQESRRFKDQRDQPSVQNQNSV